MSLRFFKIISRHRPGVCAYGWATDLEEAAGRIVITGRILPRPVWRNGALAIEADPLPHRLELHAADFAVRLFGPDEHTGPPDWVRRSS